MVDLRSALALTATHTGFFAKLNTCSGQITSRADALPVIRGPSWASLDLSSHGRATMEGLDVAMEETSVCVLDGGGNIFRGQDILATGRVIETSSRKGIRRCAHRT
jgi:hypothetical protein